MAEWVSITEAADRLTRSGDPVNRSTLSRYLKQHAEALELRPDGKSNLVDFAALAAHRAGNVRLRPSAVSAPPASGSRHAAREKAVNQAESVARKAAADAEMREMDLAERRRELTPVAEVDRGGRDAVALMVSAYERSVETIAADAALRYGWDERTVRIILKRFAKEGLGVFHREMLGLMDRLQAGATPGEADEFRQDTEVSEDG